MAFESTGPPWGVHELVLGADVDANRSGQAARLTRMHPDRGSSAQFTPVREIHPFVDDPIWR
jgi:hypothetical protein